MINALENDADLEQAVAAAGGVQSLIEMAGKHEDSALVQAQFAGVLRDLIAAQAPADIANSVVIETLTIESAHGGDKFSQHVLLQAVRSGGC